MKCRIAREEKDQGFLGSVNKHFPFAIAQSEIDRYTYMKSESDKGAVKIEGELADAPKPHDSRNPLKAVYGPLTIANFLKLGEKGEVEISDGIAVFNPKYGGKRGAKAVNVVDKKYDSEVAGDSEHRMYTDFSGGQLSSRSQTAPFTIVLDKDGKLSFREGAKIHIAGYGFVSLPTDAPLKAVVEMLKFYGSENDELLMSASREAVCCLVSDLKQVEGSGTSKGEDCIPVGLESFYKEHKPPHLVLAGK